MNYELAKKLKEAGFPQGHYQMIFNEVKEHPERETIFAEAYGVKSLDEIAYQPNLSELIEACGGIEHQTIRIQSYWTENDLMWQADDSGNFYVKPDQIAGIGSTPEIAVANLYLELNKK